MIRDAEIRHADGTVEKTRVHLNPRRNPTSDRPETEPVFKRSEKNIPRILICSALTIILMIAFPPFSLKLENGRELFAGYHFILNPGVRATVDVAVLLVQTGLVILVTALLIAAQLFSSKRF